MLQFLLCISLTAFDLCRNDTACGYASLYGLERDLVSRNRDEYDRRLRSAISSVFAVWPRDYRQLQMYGTAVVASGAADGKDCGRGVITTEPIPQYAAVMLFGGTTRTLDEIQRLERIGASDDHWYMKFTRPIDGNEVYIDPSLELATYGYSRLLNHFKLEPLTNTSLPTCRTTLYMESLVVDNTPCVVFRAYRDLLAGTELLWDYGPFVVFG